jgi:hypothetical protein
VKEPSCRISIKLHRITTPSFPCANANYVLYCSISVLFRLLAHIRRARAAGTHRISVASKRKYRNLQISPAAAVAFKISLLFYGIPPGYVNFRIQGDSYVAENGHH